MLDRKPAAERKNHSMSLRYKCVVLDHDDTVVDSTPMIHHPAYVRYMEKHPRDAPILDLQHWFLMLWEQGYTEYLKSLHLTDEERVEENAMWKEFAQTKHPKMFPGMLELLTEFKQLGGLLCVCSHSYPEAITRHYSELTDGKLTPDMVFGLELGEEHLCKPSPYPIHRIIERYRLLPEDIVVIDDMKPGFEMAQRAGVDAVGVTYGAGHELVVDRFPEFCKYIVSSVDGLRPILFSA